MLNLVGINNSTFQKSVGFKGPQKGSKPLLGRDEPEYTESKTKSGNAIPPKNDDNNQMAISINKLSGSLDRLADAHYAYAMANLFKVGLVPKNEAVDQLKSLPIYRELDQADD